jgi:tetratricopeptide (TPR) repeat protein
MSDAPRQEIPLPKGDDDFEDLVLALFREVWKDPGARLHGRRGQRQDGVDLYGEDRFGGSGLHGVQCKHPRAVAFGEQSVELADRSGDAFERLSDRTAWADALHQAGRWEESAAAFREAEAMQAERQPPYPRLYSQGGFRYCDLLLARAEPEAGAGLSGLAGPGTRPEEVERFRQACREVLERARQFFEWRVPSDPLLDIALDHLTLGRAHLGLALTATGEDSTAQLAQAAEELDRAVDGLRRAAAEEFVSRGLLARAALRRFRTDFDLATADLAEALEIAERGPMRLHECDAHLEWARLCRDQGDLAAARRHLARARELVRETGYGRREREVGWLEGVVGS